MFIIRSHLTFNDSFCLSAFKYLSRKNSTLNLKTVKRKCGQPTAETHPHLLKNGEIVPSIRSEEFQSRRQKLLESVIINQRNDIKHHLIIIPSASKKYMSDKIPYVFRQNTDYLYLSGCLEPDSCLIINSKPNSTSHFSTLFVRNPDSHSEQWDGPRTSKEEAINFFGVDNSLHMDDLQLFLYSYLKTNKNCAVWYDFIDAVQPGVTNVVNSFLQNTSKLDVRWDSPKIHIHKIRLIKSSAEIELMKKSCEIGSKAIIETMAFSKPGITEHQLFAKVDYESRMGGAEYLAYPPVVAGGDRANIIHYINNNQRIQNGEMVLMDAGCEYHGYSSDITRTWPVNGKFSTEQKIIYEIVQNVQNDLINLLYSFPTLDNLFDSMCVMLGKKLQENGLVPRNATSEQLFKLAYQFCPHHVSHYLGMDVHDTPTIQRNIRLQPGMIITVEPGIYINDKHNVPLEFQGLGIRIEDDVLITDIGPVVLTKNCPTDVTDIEKIVNKFDS